MERKAEKVKLITAHKHLQPQPPRCTQLCELPVGIHRVNAGQVPAELGAGSLHQLVPTHKRSQPVRSLAAATKKRSPDGRAWCSHAAQA